MEWQNEIKNIVEEYNNQPFYIFQILRPPKNFMILNEPSTKENIQSMFQAEKNTNF